jgi:dynein heavy chain
MSWEGACQAASRLVQRYMKRGGWIILENCHVCKSWMPELGTLVELIQASGTSVAPDFRLWVTTAPVSMLPV